MATRKPAAPAAGKKPKAAPAATQTGSYKHTEPKALLRPEIGVQNYAASQGKFKRGPTKYRYDDSLAPELTWDSQNPARERGEALIAKIAATTEALRGLPLPQVGKQLCRKSSDFVRVEVGIPRHTGFKDGIHD